MVNKRIGLEPAIRHDNHHLTKGRDQGSYHPHIMLQYYITLNWSYFEWLKYKTAKPLLYTVYRTIETENSQEGNDHENRSVLGRFRKTVSVGAEVTSGDMDGP